MTTTTTLPSLATLNLAAAQLAQNEQSVAQQPLTALQATASTLAGFQGQLPTADVSATGQAIAQVQAIIANLVTYQLPQRITALEPIAVSVTAATAAAASGTTTISA